MSGFTFESVFSGSDTPLRPSHAEKPNTSDNTAKARDDLENFLKKTPLMILEEGAKGVYQKTPSWTSGEIQSPTGIEFEMTLSLNGKTVRARANNKKTGKQKAATIYLHQLVEEGKRLEFSIPGDTDEEARVNIDLIAGRPTEESKKPVVVSAKDLDKSIPTVNAFPTGVDEKNYVGQLQELCQKMKVEAPTYEEEKRPTGEFMVTCSMKDRKTRGLKSKIRLAKNLSAWLMLKAVEGDEALQNFDMTAQFDEMEVDEALAEVQNTVFNTRDKKSALIELLSDKGRFAGYKMEFIYPSVSTMGTHQILLNIVIARPVSPDPDDLQVGAEHTQTEEIMKAYAEREREQKKNMPDASQKTFPGHGSTEEEAQQSACKSALVHYHTFDFNN